MKIDRTIFRFFSFCLTALSLLTGSHQALAQKKVNTYYLVIGSGNYATDSLEQGANGFANINSPGYSATLMDSVFNRYHFNNGLKLISTDTSAITKIQIDTALSELISMAKKDQATGNKQCVFVIYYAGHGVKHPSSFDLFLVPGYFPNNMKYVMVGTMREVSHSVLSVYYKLKWARDKDEPWQDFRIVMLMDCCYNSDHDDHIPFKYSQSSPDSFYNALWEPPMEIELFRPRKKQKSKPKIQYDDELGRFYKEDAAYFAASNGNYAQTVASPLPGDNRMIAPICRRTLLFTAKAKGLNFDDYLNFLTDTTADPGTQPIKYFHKPETKIDVTLSLK